MFLNDDNSPVHTRTTASSSLTSTRTPTIATSASRKDQQLDSSIKNHGAISSGRVVKESSKLVKKPRSLKPKVLKSSSKEPPPKSPLTTSVAVSSLMKTPQGRPHQSAIKKPNSSLAMQKTTEAASELGCGRGKVGGARSREDKENASPLPAVVPKAHDILAEQVGELRMCGKGSSRLVLPFV
jgi:hypothetical protein